MKPITSLVAVLVVAAVSTAAPIPSDGSQISHTVDAPDSTIAEDTSIQRVVEIHRGGKLCDPFVLLSLNKRLIRHL